MRGAAAAPALLLTLALAGCAAPGRPAGPDPAPPRIAALVPTATGVDIPGTGREIGFGRHLPGAEAALTRLYGPPARRPCAGGTILAVGGVELHFTGDTLTGWRTPEAAAGRMCASSGRDAAIRA